MTRRALRGSSLRWRSQRDVRGLGLPEQHPSFLEGRPTSRLCLGSQQRCRCTVSEVGWGLRALVVAGREALDRIRALSQLHDQIPGLVLDRGGRRVALTLNRLALRLAVTRTRALGVGPRRH